MRARSRTRSPLLLLSLSLLGLLAAAAGCGPNVCEKACRQLATCQGIDPAKLDESGWTCPLSDTCSGEERCAAQCAEEASCAALSGQDLVAAAAIARCTAECAASLPRDAGPAGRDARPRSDGHVASSDGPPGYPDLGSCVPRCAERECGGDGCGGSCGDCTSPAVCNYNNGTCAALCVPDCTDRACGDDGCGGSCGGCTGSLVCDEAQGRCETPCTPACYGKQCGDDGCGGTCGTCSVPKICIAKTSTCELACEPDCTGRQCGDDGCGGSCGTCTYPTTCDAAGHCSSPVTSSSFGASCDTASPLCDSGLGCVGVGLSPTDPPPTAGFCTKSCATLGQSCTGGPSGTFSACAMEGQDTAGATVYLCAFLCAVQGQPYKCPPSLTCSADEVPAGSGVKVCLP